MICLGIFEGREKRMWIGREKKKEIWSVMKIEMMRIEEARMFDPFLIDC